MKRYCEKCKRRIKGNEFVDISQLDNPLLTGYWHNSCLLVTIYEVIDEIRINTSFIMAKLGIEKK